MTAPGDISVAENVDAGAAEAASNAASLLSVTLRTRQQRFPLRATPAPTAGEPVPHRHIGGYWRSLVGKGTMPPRRVLDQELIDQTWPRTLLLARCGRGAVPALDLVYSRLWHADAAPQFDDETCHLLLEALVADAQNVMVTGQPAMARHRVGAVQLRLIALPLGDDRRTADHVLCQLEALDT